MLTQVESSLDENGIATITLAGRFTLGSSLGLADLTIKQCIDTQGARKLVFDLTGITFMDSAGLGLIVYTQGRMQDLGGQVRVAAPAPQVMKIFQMTRTDAILQIDPDLKTSVEKLKI